MYYALFSPFPSASNPLAFLQKPKNLPCPSAHELQSHIKTESNQSLYSLQHLSLPSPPLLPQPPLCHWRVPCVTAVSTHHPERRCSRVSTMVQSRLSPASSPSAGKRAAEPWAGWQIHGLGIYRCRAAPRRALENLQAQWY